jgi:hypothetical protein
MGNSAGGASHGSPAGEATAAEDGAVKGAAPSEPLGFNMRFSPELVRRLQGSEEAEAAQAAQQAAQQAAEAEREREREQRERKELKELKERQAREERQEREEAGRRAQRDEDTAFAEVRDMLRSGPMEELKPAPKPHCGAEKDACVKCIADTGSVADCQDMVAAFNDCLRKHKR